jgi:hypothetical protein
MINNPYFPHVGTISPLSLQGTMRYMPFPCASSLAYFSCSQYDWILYWLLAGISSYGNEVTADENNSNFLGPQGIDLELKVNS